MTAYETDPTLIYALLFWGGILLGVYAWLKTMWEERKS